MPVFCSCSNASGCSCGQQQAAAWSLPSKQLADHDGMSIDAAQQDASRVITLFRSVAGLPVKRHYGVC